MKKPVEAAVVTAKIHIMSVPAIQEMFVGAVGQASRDAEPVSASSAPRWHCWQRPL